MLSLKSGDSVQDFINKLSKKENLFSRHRRSGRLSVLPSKLVTNAGNRLPTEGYNEVADGQPLMDVSNQEINDGEEHGENAALKGVHKSALLREFHERRRSKLSSMGVSNPRRSVATPSQNKPFLMSARKRTPLISTRQRNTSIDNERVADPIVRLLCDKIMRGNQRQTGIIPSIRVSPSPHRKNLLENNSGRKGLLASASKRTESAEKNNSRQLRSHQSRNVSSLSATNVNDQDCCRALMFSDIDEEKGPEVTQPLPVVQLSAVKSTGSMLNRRSTITVKATEPKNKKYISPSIPKEKAPLINKSKDKQINNAAMHKPVPTYQRRHSGIPMPDKSSKGEVLHQRRRSDLPTTSSNRLTIIVKDALLPVTEHREKPTRRKSRIPLHEEFILSNKSPEFLNKISLPGIVVSPDKSTATDAYNKPSIGTLRKSFPSAESSIHENCENLKNTTTVEEEDISQTVRIPMKDVGTNTSTCNGTFNNSVKDIESKMEKLIEDQNRTEEAFDAMALEFFAKGKNLLLEYKRNIFEGIQEIKGHFEQLSSQKSVNEKNCENCQAVDCSKVKSSKKDYTFLGTPMPKKNKKRIIRSFSDPTSPCNRSPCVRETSFHSVDSVMSPFTNIVGDCDRPSLMPMTPRMRHNITDLKVSLNEQLESLFR